MIKTQDMDNPSEMRERLHEACPDLGRPSNGSLSACVTKKKNKRRRTKRRRKKEGKKDQQN